MKPEKTTNFRVYSIFFLSGLFVIQTCLQAAELPSINVLIDKAAMREKLFDDLDAYFTFDRYNPDRDTPVFRKSCRWVKHGTKMFIDFQKRDYMVADREVLRHTKMSYDGKTARSLFVLAMKGKVFRDFKKDIVRGHYNGPDIMGITLPMAPGETVSSLLKGNPLLAPKLGKRIARSVNIVGQSNVDGTSCVIVDVTIGDSPDFQELTRLYLAEDYDYCVFQAEHSFVRNGVPSLGSRIRMSKFQHIKDDLFYPLEAKYDVFQGQEKPKQTTFFKTEKISWPKEFNESLFALEFPAGTHVFDTIVGIDYVAGGGYIQEYHIDGEENIDIGQIDIDFQHSKVSTNYPEPNLTTKVFSANSKKSTDSNEILSHDEPHRQSLSLRTFFPRTIILIVGAILVIAVVIMMKRRVNRNKEK